MSAVTVLSVVLLYFLILLLVGYLTGRHAKNNAFFIGNRQSPWGVVAYGMIGASLSGITFISVPGWVVSDHFQYLQMVIGYIFGYVFIANVLLPVFYRLKLTSIYEYLNERFDIIAYKTGSVLFLFSRIIGASFRLFVVASILQVLALNSLGVPFPVTIMVIMLLIWAYTYRGGIKTIVWTDMLQTTFMLLTLVATIIVVLTSIHLSVAQAWHELKQYQLVQIFDFSDWRNPHYFWKQLLAGAFMAIAMTGLDQDMMQKNLSCRNLKESKKNVYLLSVSLLLVNFVFLFLGALLVYFVKIKGLEMPADTDYLFSYVVIQSGMLPIYLGVFFIIGLVAAAFSSADSALTALTTSFTIDILGVAGKTEREVKRLRIRIHFLISILIILVIVGFSYIKQEAIISSLFKIASYTYGPLLGLYFFGLFTKIKLRGWGIPVIAVVSILLTYLFANYAVDWFDGYQFGFELLLLNGMITFAFLWILGKILK